jgi:hypothetical protein
LDKSEEEVLREFELVIRGGEVVTAADQYSADVGKFVAI